MVRNERDFSRLIISNYFEYIFLERLSNFVIKFFFAAKLKIFCNQIFIYVYRSHSFRSIIGSIKTFTEK
jgi:hypothetical protein